MKKILIFGATSAIAQATAKIFATEGCSFFLVARSTDKLMIVESDLLARGADHVSSYTMDALDYNQHNTLFKQAEEAMGGVDIFIIAHGSLPDQAACESSFDATHHEIQVNAISAISLLTHAANYFEEKKSGLIAVISSVAGDRGRHSNYIYGCAKGMLTVYLQGLRDRLYKSNIQVLTLKPGFVDTPMTHNFRKGLLWSSPETAARSIHRAIDRRKHEAYIPAFWHPIMLIIKAIPNMIFRRLNI